MHSTIALPARASRRSSARNRLREATHESHERMHRLRQFRSIEAHELSLPGYVRLLHALAAYHGAIATVAAREGQAGLSSSARRLEQLRRDLKHLGATDPSAFLSWMPRSAHALLGGLYVAEGSMLGGRVIARQLDYLFGEDSNGRRFFIGTKEDTRTWHYLLAVIEEVHCREDAIGEMIAGAEASFALFEDCIGAFA